MKEKCGECKYHGFAEGDWMCCCRDSTRYGEYTEYGENCEEFEYR